MSSKTTVKGIKMDSAYRELTAGARKMASAHQGIYLYELYCLLNIRAPYALRYALFAKFNTDNDAGATLVSGSPDWQLVSLSQTADAAYKIVSFEEIYT